MHLLESPNMDQGATRKEAKFKSRVVNLRNSLKRLLRLFAVLLAWSDHAGDDLGAFCCPACDAGSNHQFSRGRTNSNRGRKS